MRINLTNNSNITAFSSYYVATPNKKLNNSNRMDKCIHESHFMRDLNSLSFSTEYLTKNFPEGAHIADFGCSNGEETYSLATLLSPHNKDSRYKITGFDIVPEVVEDAKLALFSIGQVRFSPIGEDKYENFLIENFQHLTPEQMSTKKAFYTCFSEIPDSLKYFNFHNPRYKQKIKKITKPGDDIELTTKHLEYLHKQDNNFSRGSKYFIPKNGVFDSVIDFKICDAARLDKELEPKSVGAFIFKNSLYHLIDSRPRNMHYYDYKNVDITPAKKLFRKIHSALRNDGIFILGTLRHDHLYSYSEKAIHQIKQNGQTINVYDSSPIHKALRKAGFEPIFYEAQKTGGATFIEYSMCLPSVWRKVKPENKFSPKKFFPKLIAKLS